MNSDVTVAGFRDFMEWTNTAGRKSTDNLGLLLNSASDVLERRTGRLITSSGSNTTRKFTTNGRAFMTIPDLRTVSLVSLQSTSLVADTTYWLVPSRQDADIAIGVQLRAFTTTNYRASPEWFDRNLDNLYPAGWDGGLPNDLQITGLWGHTFTPYDWKVAIYALAGYYYQHADALFSGARATPDGFLLNLDAVPSEVRDLVTEWSIAEQVALA